MAIAQTRQVVLEVLLRVAGGASANAALDEALSHSSLDSRDRGFVTELVDGTLRWQGRLDYQLAQLVEGPLAKLDPAVLQVLRIGAYQLTQLERVPAHAAVNEAVEQARARAHEGAAKLVNAVLRRLEREKDILPFPDPEADAVAYLTAKYSHPAWLVTRWLARFGLQETEALLVINNTPPPLTLRMNRRWVTREGLQSFLKLREIETMPTSISPNGLILTSGGNPREIDLYQEGLFSIQGEGSMVMVELLKPGRRRDGWDMAAGVGGKTTYLAEWVDDSGTLLATDTSVDRLHVLQRELQRLELTSVRVETGDARTFHVDAESMDYILLDAPCTGTGSLRRQADARWRKTLAQLAEMAVLQRELLEAASRAAKPGGLLLYCTCSLEPEENEDVVAPFLADHPEWSLDVEGIKHPTLPDDARDPAGYVRLLPQRHGTDGFFAARLIKADA
jgi:16S rRNA (cytosine967-C5)-methyltransferase